MCLVFCTCIFILSLVVSSMSSDNSSLVASWREHTREHKTASFSTKAVLPKIQQKKVAITPREMSSSREHVKPEDKPVPSAEYSPAAYTDIQDDNVMDKDTQLAIDVLHSQSDTSVLYHYSSHPHSAHRNSPNTRYRITASVLSFLQFVK